MLPKGWQSYSKRQLIDIVNGQATGTPADDTDAPDGIDDTVNNLIMSNVISLEKHRYQGVPAQQEFTEDQNGKPTLARQQSFQYDIDYISSDNKRESSDDECEAEPPLDTRTNRLYVPSQGRLVVESGMFDEIDGSVRNKASILKGSIRR